MGVFTKSMIGVLLVAMPWRWRSESEDLEAELARREESTPRPTRQTCWRHYPSSSVLRADLEAMRRHP